MGGDKRMTDRKPELEALLNNTVDDDEAILLQRELAGEEEKSDGS